MIIKAEYFYKGNKMGDVKIDTETQDINTVVQASAPKYWDVCDANGVEILPEVKQTKRIKKREVEVLEEPEIQEEDTDDISE